MTHRWLVALAALIWLTACSSPPAAEPPVETADMPEPAPTAPPDPTTDAGLIQIATSAAPPDVSADATVVEPEEDGSMRELRAGTNGWVCMAHPFPMCLDGPWQAFMQAWQAKTNPTITNVGIAYMLQGDTGTSNTDPFATAQTPDNDWVVAGPHLMIITPDTRQLEELPTDYTQGGPWVMWKGTPYAHIMVPTTQMP